MTTSTPVLMIEKGRTPKSARLANALVAFSGQTELAWLHLLRPGFRHCFVLVEVRPEAHEGHEGREGEGLWILYNPLSSGTQIAVWPRMGGDAIRAWLSQQGYTVLETRARSTTARVFNWRPYTCVEAVKRVLGLHGPAVFTPWQLFKFIKKQNRENNP